VSIFNLIRGWVCGAVLGGFQDALDQLANGQEAPDMDAILNGLRARMQPQLPVPQPEPTMPPVAPPAVPEEKEAEETQPIANNKRKKVAS
jgi:hypothetical protein